MPYLVPIRCESKCYVGTIVPFADLRSTVQLSKAYCQFLKGREHIGFTSITSSFEENSHKKTETNLGYQHRLLQYLLSYSRGISPPKKRRRLFFEEITTVHLIWSEKVLLKTMH